MQYTATTAADELGISVQGVRKAIKRGRIGTLPVSDSTARISEQALERYRRRRRFDDRNMVSWDLDELPTVAETPPTAERGGAGADPRAQRNDDAPETTGGKLLSQQLVSFTMPYGLSFDRELLVRVFSQPEESPAAAVVVLGDIQRGSRGLSPQNIGLVAQQIVDSMTECLPNEAGVLDLAWILATGAVHLEDPKDSPNLFTISLVEDGDRFDEFTARLVRTEEVDRVLDHPLETWPAVDPDVPRQQRLWRQVINGGQSRQPVLWVVDRGQAEDHYVTLGRLLSQFDQEHEPLRAQFAAQLADEVSGVFNLIDHSPLALYRPWLKERIAVPYDYWRPSQAQRAQVNDLASHRRPELLEASYKEALAWLKDVDEFSPTPDPAMAAILERALGRVQFYNQTVEDVDLPSPPRIPVDDLVLDGGVAEDWIASLHTVHDVPSDNSREARQIRALLHSLGHDVAAFLREQYQVISRDEAGVFCMVSDDRANVLAVRPTNCEHLDTTGATVEAHRDPSRGGDLAVFLRLNTGVLTLLPHEAEHSGVQFGYSGTGPSNLADDIVNAYPADKAPAEDERRDETKRVFQEISVEGLTDLTINL